jgi:hypothetical protein
MGSANSASIADVPESRLRETISPELVLVDPELRRRVLAELVQNDALDALAARSARLYPPPPRAVAEPVRARPPAQRPMPAAPRRRASRWPKARLASVLPGLVVLGVFVALGVSEARVSEPTLGPPPPGRTSPTAKPDASPTAAPRSITPVVGDADAKTPRRARASRVASAVVERKVLAQIVQAPGGKLPRALIDSTTGLAKNGLQAVCRPSGGDYLCVVRPTRHREGEGLRVRYRGGVFTWYGYRRG